MRSDSDQHGAPLATFHQTCFRTPSHGSKRPDSIILLTTARWAKYPQFAALLKVEDPKTKKPAARNVPLHDNVEDQEGANIPALVARGVHFTVCGAATEFIAKILADKTGDPKAIEAELAANLIPNARMVPAGVGGVQRAQKAGFAYTFAG